MGEGTLLRIGELAERTGVSVKAIRHYERLGLLYTAGRTAANYRLYPPEAIACVRAIKLWRRLGFSLNEMRAMTELFDHGSNENIDRQLLASLRERAQELTARIEQLEALRRDILAFCERYEVGLRRGQGARDYWQAMQEAARDEYLQSQMRG